MKITIENFNIGNEHIDGFIVDIPDLRNIEDVKWESVVESIIYNHADFKNYEEEA